MSFYRDKRSSNPSINAEDAKITINPDIIDKVRLQSIERPSTLVMKKN